MSTTATHPPAKAEIQANAAADLRSAYLYVYDHAPTDLVQVVDNCRFNTRYAREILGRLTHDGFLTEENNDADGGDVWYYNDELFTQAGLADNRTSAEELVDGWLTQHGLKAPPSPPTATPPSRSKPKRTIPGSDCACGCGTATKALFAPGHDARMAGVVARAIATDGDFSRLEQLPTPPLRVKARAHAERLLAKGSTPPIEHKQFEKVSLTEDHSVEEIERRTGEPFYTYGVVKIGKNRFAARRNPDGVIMRNNKALPNTVISLNAYAEMDYTATVEGNPFKSFKALEVQP